MSPVYAMVLDAVVAVLLIATIAFAVRLNQRLLQLRENRAEMEALIRTFTEATARADSGIKTMRRTAADTGEALQRAIDRAQQLRDELQFMVETADSLANRLSGAGSAKGSPAKGGSGAGGASGGDGADLHDDEDPIALTARAVAAARPAAPARPAPRPREGAETMSRAERELLEAMENRR